MDKTIDRKSYSTPQVIEYGQIIEITKAEEGAVGDVGSGSTFG